MYIQLIRNKPQGNSITGRLVIDGRWFCNTLERVGYQIPALCYQIRVTKSPKFKRLLPVVQNVPQRSGIRFHRGTKPQHSTGCILVVADNINDNTDNLRGNQLPAAPKENIPCRSRDILISPKGSNDRSAYDSSMKKLLNGGSIESACHNSYDKNQANGRINQLSILSSVIIPNFFLSLFPPSVFFYKKNKLFSCRYLKNVVPLQPEIISHLRDEF